MKFVLVLPVSGTPGWAAIHSRALSQAHAGLVLEGEGKYELWIPGRQEK